MKVEITQDDVLELRLLRSSLQRIADAERCGSLKKAVASGPSTYRTTEAERDAEAGAAVINRLLRQLV